MNRFTVILGIASCLALTTNSDSLVGQSKPIPSQVPLRSRLDFAPTQEWIENYFRQRNRVDDDVANLFRDLGSSEYPRRRAAQKKLQTLPFVPQALLDEYAKSQNPEIRFYVKALTQKRAELERMYIHHVLEAVAEKSFKGFALPIMKLANTEDESYKRWALPIAVFSSANEKDRDALSELLSKDSKLDERYRRRIAIWGLTAIESGEHPLDAKLFDGNDEFTLDRALALLAKGDRRCIDLLVKLSDSEFDRVRVMADAALQRCSGKWMGYIGGKKPEARAAAVKAWQSWSKTVDRDSLRYDKPLFLLPEFRLKGNMLLGFKSKDDECGIMTVSPNGLVIDHIGNFPCFWAEILPNGNLLATVRVGSQPAVVELDWNGKILWQYNGSNLLKSHALSNGNVVICFQQKKRIIEVNREKEIVWGTVTDGPCNDIALLHDGRRIIGTDDGMYIVSQDGSESTQVTDIPVSGIEVLADGELLLASWKKSKVFKMSIAGEKRWEYSIGQAMTAHQSIDGSICVSSGQSGFRILSDTRKSVKSFSGMSGRVILR